MLKYSVDEGRFASNTQFEREVEQLRRLHASIQADRAYLWQEHIATRGLSTERGLGIHTKWAAYGVRSEIAEAIRDVEREYGRFPTFSELLRRLWRPRSAPISLR
jgi:hypothetical protein